MDVLSFFSGSDNLYKHLFIGGLGIIILSLFYPLQKETAKREQKDLYNKEIKLLNFEIENLHENVKDIQDLSETYKQTLSSIPKTKKKKYTKLRAAINENFDKQVEVLKKQRADIEIKKINVEYNKDALLTLEQSISAYHKYTSLFFWVGMFFTIVGVVGWTYITHRKP